MKIVDRLLTVNPYSRPGPEYKLREPRFVVMHWVANPRTDADFNRRFWESRKSGRLGFGGGHYVVDDDGALRCAPDDEMTPHVGTSQGITRWGLEVMGNESIQGYSATNYYCIAVEMCHVDWEGSYSEATYANAVELVAILCDRHKRDPYRDIITHNLVVGWKDCPRWFVKNVGELELFRHRVAKRLEQGISSASRRSSSRLARGSRGRRRRGNLP